MRRRIEARYRENRNENRLNITDSLVKWGSLLLTILLLVSLTKNIIRYIEAEKRINEISREVNELQTEKTALEKSIAEAESDFYVEKEARDKLGLAKEGETVLVLPDDEALNALAPKHKETTSEGHEPNWKRWWNIFL